MDAAIKFLYLSEPDMIRAGVKDMDACVDVMEDTLMTLHRGDYVMGGENHNSHGTQIIFPDHPQFPGMPANGDDRRFMAMPAYLGGNYQMAGMKWYGSNIANRKKGLPRSILMMMLNDKDSGAPLAMMSANLVSCYRTGAVSGVGVRHLARKGAEVLSVIGPGVMGRTTAMAAISACPTIKTVKIKGRGRASIDKFIDTIKASYPQAENFVICDTVEEAVRDSDIICTTATAPVHEKDFTYIDSSWVRPGALFCMPSAARFDDEFIQKAVKVVDNRKLYESWAEEFVYPSFEMVQIIGAKFTDMIHEGKIQKEDVIHLPDIISGDKPARRNDDDIIIYSVGGMPVEDIAWGGHVYRNALRMGIGTELPLWDKPDMA